MEMRREQTRMEELLKKEKERSAARQWWKTPYSSSTTAWVHSGGEQRTNTGEVRPWANTLDESMVAQPNDSTINLDSTQEEMEVLLLDQDLGEPEPELVERMDTGEMDNATEKEGSASNNTKRT